MRYWLPVFCVFVLAAYACQKDDTHDPAKDIEGYWDFQGFQDTLTKEITPPPSFTDTLPDFGMNIVFRKIGYYQPYELEGQGPVNLYWASFHAGKNETLTVSDLYVTTALSKINGLSAYEKAYFDSLLSVTGYTVTENALLLTLHGSSGLLYSRSDRSIYHSDFFMQASIDGLDWTADMTNTEGVITYDSDASEHHVSIISQTRDTLPNGRRYEIELMLNYPPVKGIYKLNNQSATIPEPGAGANCHGWKDQIINNYFITWSTNGIVEITDITRASISGQFHFDAIATGTNPYVKAVSVTDGTFYVPLTQESSNWFVKYASGNP